MMRGLYFLETEMAEFMWQTKKGLLMEIKGEVCGSF